MLTAAEVIAERLSLRSRSIPTRAPKPGVPDILTSRQVLRKWVPHLSGLLRKMGIPTLIFIAALDHIYACTQRLCRIQKNRAPEVRFLRLRMWNRVYCPELATEVVIASGRFSSSVSSVPAGSVAERCLLSQ